MHLPIILASTSPRRKMLMDISGLKYTIEDSNYEEDMSLDLLPHELAKFLSRGKAKAVATKHSKAIIIAADTFVVHDGKLMGKPKSKADARRMLRQISNNNVSVITGLTIINSKLNKTISKSVETKVYFRKISNSEIDNYIKTGEPMDKAGAFAMQGIGALFIKRVEGDYLCAVGLPLYDLFRELKKFGVTVV